MTEWQDLTEKQPSYRPDPALYERARTGRTVHSRVEGVCVPPGEGRAIVVKRGHVLRIIAETGPQIGSVAFWNAHDHRETFAAARTWAHEGVYVRPFARMLSGVPWVRPMATCIDQTIAPEVDGEYRHHSLGTHCSPEVLGMWFGRPALNSCRENLLTAIAGHGLGERDLHDSLSVHKKSRIGDPERGRVFLAPSDARAGDYVEFFAEMDLLVAVSVCPLGDGSADPTVSLDSVRPLRIDVYDTGLEPQRFPPCTDWRLTWKGRWEWPAP